MNIIIITQNEPFYLYKNLQYLLNNLPESVNISGVVLSDPSPYGKSESFIKKARKTFRIFGLSFFLYYGFRYSLSKIFKKSIKSLLLENKIPEISIKGSINSKESLSKIRAYKPDLLVSILGNQIFKKQLIELAPMGCINLHTALLPKYRGLMPTFWVLKNNETHTGVSVFFVDEGIDSGPIITQEIVAIGEKSQRELIEETKKIGMELILKSIVLINSQSYKLIDNPESEKSYYSFPTREDVKEFKTLGKRFF